MKAMELAAVAEENIALNDNTEQDIPVEDRPFQVPGHVFAGLPETEIVKTRFGDIEVSRKSPIFFPLGLLGLPNALYHSLVPFPNEKLQGMMWLQSLNDLGFGLITMPVTVENDILDKEDMLQAAAELGIPKDRLVTLLVVNITRTPEGVSLTVNARAPIFVHSTQRLAAQHVFSNQKYEIKHPVSK